MKVDEKTDREVASMKVAHQLGQVHIGDLGDSLQLNNDLAFNDKIEKLVPKVDPLVRNPDRMLTIDMKSSKPQLMLERLLIQALQEAGSKRPMHFDSASDDTIGQDIQV